MLNSKWQWIDDHFGPMGWFTDEAKTQLEGTKEFQHGHWRPISAEELAQANADLGRLAYEQS